MKRIIYFICIVLLLSCSKKYNSDYSENEYEVRGTWITNVDSDVLKSRESIAEAMKFLADHNFNVVCPVVWNKAVTLYKSEVMDSIFGIPIDSVYGDRDPLQELIEEAHKNNLKVIAWFEFGFSAHYKQNGGHILKMKPQWAAKDRVGNLLTKNGFEWMNAYHPEVQQFMLRLVCEVVKKYDVDGIQGDDRLPAQPVEGGYSEYTMNLYKSEHDGNEPPNNFRNKEWMEWRASKLNAFAAKIYKSVKKIKKDVLVTWSPSILPFAYDEYLQDWSTWIEQGYADMVFPQVYRYSIDEYNAILNSKADYYSKNFTMIFPGILMNIGDYVIENDYFLSALETNRNKNYNGEMYFFYEGLRKNDNELAKILRNTFYKNNAKFPLIK